MKNYIRLLLDPFLGMLASQGAKVGNNIIDAGMGLLLQGIQDQRQLRMQKRLQEMQMSGARQMTDYNMKKQLEMWEATNYSAQVKQLQKAGLNPALIYGMGGGGGTTADVATGNVSGGTAQNQGILGLMQGQNALTTAAQIDVMKAQAENLRADAQNKRDENPNIPKQGVILDRTAAKLEEERKAIIAGVTNTQAQTRLTNLKYDVEEFQLQFDKMTAQDRAEAIKKQNDHIDQTITNLKTQNRIDDAVADNKRARLQAEMALIIMDTWLKGEQGKAASQSVKESIARISDMFNDNMRESDEQSNKNSANQLARNEAAEHTGFPKELLSWLNIFIPIGGPSTAIPKGTKPPEVGGFKTSKQ